MKRITFPINPEILSPDKEQIISSPSLGIYERGIETKAKLNQYNQQPVGQLRFLEYGLAFLTNGSKRFSTDKSLLATAIGFTLGGIGGYMVAKAVSVSLSKNPKLKELIAHPLSHFIAYSDITEIAYEKNDFILTIISKTDKNDIIANYEFQSNLDDVFDYIIIGRFNYEKYVYEWNFKNSNSNNYNESELRAYLQSKLERYRNLPALNGYFNIW